jgi:hypothetical protein
MEFAAGILDKVSPALDAVTEALSRIDAAALGQKFADMFTGGVEGMRGFQSAVDAFKTGNIEGALAVLWQSIKVQAMMTADEIYKNIISAFKAAIQFIVELFNPSGPVVNTILNAFKFIGLEIVAIMARTFQSIADIIPDWLKILNPALAAADFAADGVISSIEQAASGALDNLKNSASGVTNQISDAATAAGQEFNSAMQDANGLFSSTNAEAEKLAQMQAEIAAKAAEAATAIESKKISEEEAAAEAKKYFEQYQSGIAAIAGQNAEKMKSIENEIALNEAIASGNEEEVKRLQEKQRQAELSQKIKDIEASLPAIIEDITSKTGASEEEAGKLAAQLVASRIAALGVAENSKGIIEPLEDAGDAAKTVRQTMEDIKNAELEASPQRLKERTIDARKELKDMADFIGQDISGMSLDDILKKLGLNPKNFKNTDDKLKALEGALKDIGDADPADITPDVDLVGVNDRLEKVKEYLKKTGEKKTDVTPQIDQRKLKTAVDSAKKAIEKGLSKNKTELNLDANKAIGKIRKDLKEQIDVAIQSSKGTEHLSSIDKLVGKIEELVSKISDKLPMQALA